MKKWQIVCMLGLLLTLLANNLSAFAQFGVGFGAWNWGGHNSGFGSWFGVSLWPNQRPYRLPPSRNESTPKANGYLEGNITVHPKCPADQPNVACPLILDALNDITISAQLYGMNQWLTSRPDAQGHYRLMLPPGGYNISVHHPYLSSSEKILHQVIIQPGQTNRQNFQVDLPIQ